MHSRLQSYWYVHIILCACAFVLAYLLQAIVCVCVCGGGNGEEWSSWGGENLWKLICLVLTLRSLTSTLFPQRTMGIVSQTLHAFRECVRERAK